MSSVRALVLSEFSCRCRRQNAERTKIIMFHTVSLWLEMPRGVSSLSAGSASNSLLSERSDGVTHYLCVKYDRDTIMRRT